MHLHRTRVLADAIHAARDDKPIHEPNIPVNQHTGEGREHARSELPAQAALCETYRPSASKHNKRLAIVFALSVPRATDAGIASVVARIVAACLLLHNHPVTITAPSLDGCSKRLKFGPVKRDVGVGGHASVPIKVHPTRDASDVRWLRDRLRLLRQGVHELATDGDASIEGVGGEPSVFLDDHREVERV